MSPKEQVFADFVPLGEFAKSIDKHPRTIQRWAGQPDGFPIAHIGKEDFVHIPTARDWVLSKVRRPNPRREAQRTGRAA